MKINKIFVILAAVPLFSSCVMQNSRAHFEKTGLKRAAFDLNCDIKKLTVMDLGEQSFGVSGCGKKAVYVGTFDGPRGGSWIRNSEVQDIK